MMVLNNKGESRVKKGEFDLTKSYASCVRPKATGQQRDGISAK